MPREEQVEDQSEEQPFHGSDDGDRDDALVAIQDAMRQISARVERGRAQMGKDPSLRSRRKVRREMDFRTESVQYRTSFYTGQLYCLSS